MQALAAGHDTDASTPSEANGTLPRLLKVTVQLLPSNCSANGPPGLPLQLPTLVQAVVEAHETAESTWPAPKLVCTGEVDHELPFQVSARAVGTRALVSHEPEAMQKLVDRQSTP
jgi:hypothetical protein